MRTLLKYKVLLLLAVALTGCKPDEVLDTLALSLASISAPETAKDYTVSITTTAKDYTATSDAEWCVAAVEKSSSSVKISVQKNRIGTSRKAKITITAGKKTAIISVNQATSVYSATNRDSVALLSLNNGALKWDALKSMDDWDGIKVDFVNGVRRVIELNISQKNYLTGTISDSIKNLTELHYIDISGLNLSGNLPSFSNLSNLIVIDAKNNKFTGNIPEMPVSVAYLSLGQNNFSGTLPMHIKNLTKLQVLDLGLNNITGSIPADWSALQNIKFFYLHGNVLSGSIPDYIATFTKLEALALDYNQLTGNIPSGLGTLNKLNKLYLHQNKLTGNVPTDITNNANWENWKSTVIYQQNGVVLTIPTTSNVKMHSRSLISDQPIDYQLPDKRSYLK